MLYEPTIYDEWEWQRVDRLILGDAVLYSYLYWLICDALEEMGVNYRIRRNDDLIWRLPPYSSTPPTYPPI